MSENVTYGDAQCNGCWENLRRYCRSLLQVLFSPHGQVISRPLVHTILAIARYYIAHEILIRIL